MPRKTKLSRKDIESHWTYLLRLRLNDHEFKDWNFYDEMINRFVVTFEPQPTHQPQKGD